MLKRMGGILLAAMLLLTGQAMAADTEGIVICETLSIRETPHTDATTIAEAYNGDRLTILAEQGDWYEVRFDDNETNAHGQGYVLRRFIMPNPSYATALGNTYVYAMPDASARMVGDVAGGTQLLVIGEWGNYWAVNLRTASGFVRKADVSYDGNPAQPTHAPQPKPTTTPINPIGRTEYEVIRNTSLYAGPSASTDVTGEMIAGSLVTIGAVQNGYGQDADNGLWLLMADLRRPTDGGTPVETSAPGAMSYLVLNDGTNVYAEPGIGSTVVDTLSAGDAVTVTETRDGFGLVRYGRQRGWVEMTDLLSFHR